MIAEHANPCKWSLMRAGIAIQPGYSTTWERTGKEKGTGWYCECYAVNPPSMVKLAPVTKPASGPAKYATKAATSSVVP